MQCHKAKNLIPEAGGQATRTGEAVLEIQVNALDRNIGLNIAYNLQDYFILLNLKFEVCKPVFILLHDFISPISLSKQIQYCNTS